MNKPKYWRGLEELEQTPEFLSTVANEFPTDIPPEQQLEEATEAKLGFKANRRDFLKLMGFGLTAATLSACVETPLKKAIPYVNKPDDIIPGVANYYATTTPEGVAVIAKCREGRPIKLEGNPDAPLTKGGMDAIGQASVLNIYDIARHRKPVKSGNASDWETVDGEIKSKLAEINAAGGKVRVVTRSILSPSTRQVIERFVSANANAKHVTYDPVSYSAIAEANEASFGKAVIPHYDMAKAKVIVGVACDFLGTWLEPTAFNAQYAENRDPDKGEMSRHYQIESVMTMTGTNADLRLPVKPSQTGQALISIYNAVAKKLGRPTLPASSFSLAAGSEEMIAQDLVANRGTSLLLCGMNDAACQSIANGINEMLNSYGNTINLDRPSYYKQGSDQDMMELLSDLTSTDAFFFYDANPVYDTPFSGVFKDAISMAKLSVSLASKPDETSKLCQYTAPDHHYLESWSDSMPVEGHYSVVQPTINPIFSTRQAQDSFLKWMGAEESYEDLLKANWEGLYKQVGGDYADFQAFWDHSLRVGMAMGPEVPSTPVSLNAQAVADAARRLNNSGSDQDELVIYEKVSIRDGKYANNPWLQELPDPVTRVTWDNYLTVPFQYAKDNGLKQEDVVNVKVGDMEARAAVVVQPGQAMGTFGLALGYAREGAGKVAKQVKGSVDAYPFLEMDQGNMRYHRTGVEVSKTGDTYSIASVQTFHTLFDPVKFDPNSEEGSVNNYFDRTEEIISETNFAAYKKDPTEVNGERAGSALNKKHHLITLWESHYKDKAANRYIRWAMAIDLNKCTGCGACVVSCNAENNVPVVGKEEVKTRREMHWIRIDRYYSGDPNNPDVVYQPMLCQHCDNAPCETVCPVLATIHSHEGLNQMTYNRCVGTRYCANNCPYKVRRFNWFNYQNGDQFTDINPSHETNPLGRFVLNPDVTVRFRGVMEKCSFCVQRLQEGKLRAKVRAGSSLNSDGSSVKPQDGEIKTACQQSCPTGAIVFGDLNDPNSEIHKLYKENHRIYHAIEEVKTLPSVAYMSKVRNRTEEMVQAIEAREEEAMKNNEWLVS
jgi:MoCo/4Fe-4S cofactor protein with predicted Tat translocation signal